MLFLFFPVSSHTHTNTYSTRVTHPPPASTSRFSNYLGLHVFWSVSRGVGAARLDAGNVQGVPLWLPELVERRRRCRDDGQQFLLVTTTRLEAQLFFLQNRQASGSAAFSCGTSFRAARWLLWHRCVWSGTLGSYVTRRISWNIPLVSLWFIGRLIHCVLLGTPSGAPAKACASKS